MDRFIPELNEFRSKFNVHNRVKLDDFDIQMILNCGNAEDLSDNIPFFEPGTMYVLYDVTACQFDNIQATLKLDDMTVAEIFRENPDDTTVYLCFKGFDQDLLKKTSDMLRSFVKENSDSMIMESEIRKIACLFIQNCMYF
jgi:hypothetical protein